MLVSCWALADATVCALCGLLARVELTRVARNPFKFVDIQDASKRQTAPAPKGAIQRRLDPAARWRMEPP